MTGSPWLTTDKGVLLVPIIEDGSTARKPLLNGVLNCGWFTDSPGGPDAKKLGGPYSLGEFAVVADTGPPNWKPGNPDEVSRLRLGPAGPGAKPLTCCGTGANMLLSCIGC